MRNPNEYTRTSSTRDYRGPSAHVLAAVGLLTVAAVFAFTPASTLARSFSSAARTAVIGNAADTSGGTGPGDIPPPIPGVPAMDAASGWVFPVKQAHQMVGPSSWSLDQGVDLGFGLGFSQGFCGSKATLVAVEDAVVTTIGISGFGGHSPVIKLTHGKYKGWSVYYGHSQPTIVHKGQVVKRGQPISSIGCGHVGYSSAPHLELGMFRGGYCCSGTVPATVNTILRRMFPTAVAAARKSHPRKKR
ncbi:MAG: M23 family metallopeptidase [Actinomycetes bacterium]